MSRQRYNEGSLKFDSRRSVWRYRWYENGKRLSKTIGTKRDFPKLGDAKAELHRLNLRNQVPVGSPIIVRNLVDSFRKERMPKRLSTRRFMESWIENHILPRWGDGLITDLQARETELWLRSLDLSPKSKTHIRGILRQLWKYAMWCRLVPKQLNPMEEVMIDGASQTVEPDVRTLDAGEFRSFAAGLTEPFDLIALLCACLGLRISEALGLRWSDWKEGTLSISRSVVNQNIDRTKTKESKKVLTIHASIQEALKAWKSVTGYAGYGDWIFASPYQAGERPWSYNQVYRAYQKAARLAGMDGFGTHTLRHSYRAWLSATQAPVTVQQRLMRHADASTTMKYGQAFTDDLVTAHNNVVVQVLKGQPVGRGSSQVV